MKYEKIKPIPKYIQRLIKKRDLQDFPSQDNHSRFYAYLTKNDGELVKVTVAVRNYKGGWYCKQVAIHGVHSDKCFVIDFMRSWIGGYCVGWYAEGLQRQKKWYEDGEWGWCYDNELDPYAPIVNMDFIEKFPEYKYSGYQFYTRMNVIQYLRIYEKFPQAEYIVKLGLQNLVMSKQILTKAAKDKRFRKWLAVHREELKRPSVYIMTVLHAYKNNASIEDTQRIEGAKKQLAQREYEPIRILFKNDLIPFFAYLVKQKINIDLYLDYLKACNYLGLDMSLPKNRYPHDFGRWHDIRADEYQSALTAVDAEKRKKLYAQFAVVAEKYNGLQYDKKSGFICLIAKSPAELQHEGEVLHHCVGRMGYDRKMAREETLIFFVRNRDMPKAPFVTIEYSLQSKRILQCYGANNHKPDETVLDYVNRVWLPYANRKIKKIVA